MSHPSGAAAPTAPVRVGAAGALSMSGAAFAAGALLVLCGWRTERLVNQAPSIYLAMRIAFSLGPMILARLAALFIRRYAVTEQRILETRAPLAQPASP